MVRGSRTQEEFAILSGIGRPMLSDYERGAVTPSGETWMKMGTSLHSRLMWTVGNVGACRRRSLIFCGPA